MENEALKAATQGWSEEDVNWLTKRVPDRMQDLAVKHSRQVYEQVMVSGAITHALGIVARHTTGNRAVQQALLVLQVQCNNLFGALLILTNKKDEFQACKADVEKRLEILDIGQVQEGDRVSKGGIVLPDGGGKGKMH